MARIDRRIAELQDRLTRKRMMNQQLANQINAATTAKQAQLRAIQVIQPLLKLQIIWNLNILVNAGGSFQQEQDEACVNSGAIPTESCASTGKNHIVCRLTLKEPI